MNSPQGAPVSLPALAGERLTRFEDYVAGFRCTFQRSDQLLRFRAYLRGLLECGARKNVEAIASAAARVMMVEADLCQSLQHFVSNSPWDAGRLFAAVRARAKPDPTAVWVVHDAVFPKKGKHSVGVQRQFARSVGKKINCQIGVFVTRVGSAGAVPLAARLYLPAAWLRECAESGAKLLPPEVRAGATKAQLALALLDELRAESGALPLAVEPGYATGEFRDALAPRGLSECPDAAPHLFAASERLVWLSAQLGLDHFEGRTWHGWHHHVALVFAACAFALGEA